MQSSHLTQEYQSVRSSHLTQGDQISASSHFSLEFQFIVSSLVHNRAPFHAIEPRTQRVPFRVIEPYRHQRTPIGDRATTIERTNAARASHRYVEYHVNRAGLQNARVP
jgi:hypothetical protein